MLVLRLSAVLLAAALLAGCASDPPADADAGQPPTASTPPPGGAAGNESATGEHVELTVASSGVYPANPGFSPARLEVPAGAHVKVTFTNADQAPLMQHDWVLDGVDKAATDAVGAGQSATAEFAAPEPGEYKFFCSIGDHRARGMEGTFVVK